MGVTFELAASAIIDAGRRLDARGWAMGGSGNYSARLDDGTFAVTVSGRHKGHLEASDVMRVDTNGRSLDGRRPSAETMAHVAIYRSRPLARAILHTHSVPAVVLTRLNKNADRIRVADYEMLKALPGFVTHEDEAALPILENDQDMDRFAGKAEQALRDDPEPRLSLSASTGCMLGAGPCMKRLARLKALSICSRASLKSGVASQEARHDQFDHFLRDGSRGDRARHQGC